MFHRFIDPPCKSKLRILPVEGFGVGNNDGEWGLIDHAILRMLDAKA